MKLQKYFLPLDSVGQNLIGLPVFFDKHNNEYPEFVRFGDEAKIYVTIAMKCGCPWLILDTEPRRNEVSRYLVAIDENRIITHIIDPRNYRFPKAVNPDCLLHQVVFEDPGCGFKHYVFRLKVSMADAIIMQMFDSAQ